MQVTGANTSLSYVKINTPTAGSFSLAQDTAESATSSDNQSSTQIDTSSFSYTQAAIQATYNAPVINPMDWITQSDKDLVQKMTGLTVKDGDTYDASGNKVESPEALSLVNDIYEMRTFGMPGDMGSQSGVTGSITAEDFSRYIKAYPTGPDVRDINIPVLEKAIQILKSQSNSTNQSPN